ncbi:hypothetical protein DIPPA_26741 [Diplonema papillatum]|nr:hypothetical protein DIPPA_26741 [Diplonema papillatum]
MHCRRIDDLFRSLQSGDAAEQHLADKQLQEIRNAAGSSTSLLHAVKQCNQSAAKKPSQRQVALRCLQRL